MVVYGEINSRLSPVDGGGGGGVVPASVTVEVGGSGSYLDCFTDASLEPPAIAVYNPDVLGVYLVLIIPHYIRWPTGDASF